MMMLDATAGNRMIWGDNRYQSIDQTVFMDVELKLGIPPNLFASSENLPFRSDVFECVIFDPPWGINMPPWWTQPASKYNNKWYGDFKSKTKMFSYIHKSQKEFQRVTDRLCLKWGERNFGLSRILPFFTKGWREVFRREIKSKKSKTKNYWVTFTKFAVCDER